MSRRSRWLLAGVLTTPLLVPVVVLALLLQARTTPATATGPALEVSTARAFEAPFESTCSMGADFQCDVSDVAGSGTSPYLVAAGIDGCWEATLNGPQGGEAPMPERRSACVTRYDHLVARFPVLLMLPL